MRFLFSVSLSKNINNMGDMALVEPPMMPAKTQTEPYFYYWQPLEYFLLFAHTFKMPLTE